MIFPTENREPYSINAAGFWLEYWTKADHQLAKRGRERRQRQILRSKLERAERCRLTFITDTAPFVPHLIEDLIERVDLTLAKHA